MKKFEYGILEGNLTSKDLNRQGDQGWELVTVNGNSAFNERYVFKREKFDEKPDK